MKTILPFLLCFILISSCGILGSDNPFDGGKGTVENPYQISTAKQLQQIGEEENLGKHFIQVKDIDASESAEFNDGKGFLPIGNIGSPFRGSYNGNGYTISNIKLSFSVSNVGLFGFVKAGIIENVQLIQSQGPNCDNLKIPTNALLQTSSVEKADDIIIIIDDIESAGLLVGYNGDGGLIRNSSSIGHLSIEKNHVGGLVGYNSGFIDQSYSNVSISSPRYSGVLAGGNTGEIINSGASGCISTAGTAGGLTAYNTFTISNSYATGNVLGSTAGGLVAYNLFGSIVASYSSGEISDFGNASGGIAAINLAEIKDSYSLSDFNVSSEAEKIGGIAGINKADGTITTSYSAGKLASEPSSAVGGVAGLNEGVIESSYWDKTATGVNTGTGAGNSDGTVSLTTEQITGPSAQENMPEFDWENIWTITADGYPILRWQEED
ncbi:hypothetical protein [Rhodohalobacter sp. 614A]|uniref:hypothetical protein n=1 Tax=Rhodohalobacter sp. 614A TaxID=2908649 RepID=UPI001F162649|nr:hypothetical protein [Rhodohalobacter sp. 614A]